MLESREKVGLGQPSQQKTFKAARPALLTVHFIEQPGFVDFCLFVWAKSANARKSLKEGPLETQQSDQKHVVSTGSTFKKGPNRISSLFGHMMGLSPRGASHGLISFGPRF